MALVVFQHSPTEPALKLGEVLQAHGHKLRTIKLFAGDPVPVDLDDVDGIVSMGGSPNVDQAAQYPWITAELAYLKKAHEAGKAIVGVCLGAQLIAAALGGKVEAMKAPEVGWKKIKQTFQGNTDVVLAGIPWESTQFHLHGQEVAALPPDSTPLAGSPQCRQQAFRVGSTTYAFQYHFECGQPDIASFATDDLVKKAGESSQQIVNMAGDYFPAYRRLGDRLCQNIAMLLFPIDRK